MRDELDERRHLVNWKDEAGEQKGRKKSCDHRSLACGELRLERYGKKVSERKYNNEKQRRADEEHGETTAERNAEPPDTHPGAERSVGETNGEIRREFSDHQFERCDWG